MIDSFHKKKSTTVSMHSNLSPDTDGWVMVGVPTYNRQGSHSHVRTKITTFPGHDISQTRENFTTVSGFEQ